MLGRDVVVAGVDVAYLVGAQGRRHGTAPYTRARSRPSAGPTRRRPFDPLTGTVHVQRDQPEGVPPLALTGERTLPDVPAENYWFRRHLAVYEWIAARVRGPARASTWPAARATARTCSPARPPSVVGVDANPEAYEHARLRYRRANLRFARGLVETLLRAGRRGRVPADDRAPPGPRRGARALPLARGGGRGAVFISTPNVLTLAPRAPRARTTPGTSTSTARRSSSELCRAHFAKRRAARAVPRAQAARARARAARSAGTGCTLAWAHGALLRLLHARDRASDFALRRSPDGRPGSRARLPRRLPLMGSARASAARWRSSCTRTCPTSRASAPGRSARSGCGRRSRAATCRCSTCSTRGAPLTLSLTPVLCDQLEAPGVAERFAAFVEGRPPRDPRARRGRACAPAGTRRLARELERSWERLRARAASASRGAAGTCWERSPRTPSGPPRRPTRSCRCWPPTRACACRCRAASSAHRRRFGDDWRGGFWLPECAYAPWLRAGSRTPA